MQPNHRLCAGVLALALILLPGATLAGGDWNDAGIDWKSYDEGLAEAKASGKPVCLVFYTEWCPHCTKYSGVFHDEGVVAKSKEFVMVRLDKDKNTELSGRYATDGQYIPRTFFLSPDGELDPMLKTTREKYQYFYHTTDPSSILRGMDRALAKFKPKS